MSKRDIVSRSSHHKPHLPFRLKRYSSFLMKTECLLAASSSLTDMNGLYLFFSWVKPCKHRMPVFLLCTLGNYLTLFPWCSSLVIHWISKAESYEETKMATLDDKVQHISSHQPATTYKIGRISPARTKDVIVWLAGMLWSILEDSIAGNPSSSPNAFNLSADSNRPL